MHLSQSAIIYMVKNNVRRFKECLIIMKPIKECILITEPQFMGLFSGSEVWLIPMQWTYRLDGEIAKVDGIILDFDHAYIGTKWIIKDGDCIGYDGEDCAIAVEPEQMMWKTAPEYMENTDA